MEILHLIILIKLHIESKRINVIILTWLIYYGFFITICLFFGGKRFPNLRCIRFALRSQCWKIDRYLNLVGRGCWFLAKHSAIKLNFNRQISLLTGFTYHFMLMRVFCLSLTLSLHSCTFFKWFFATFISLIWCGSTSGFIYLINSSIKICIVASYILLNFHWSIFFWVFIMRKNYWLTLFKTKFLVT